MTAGTTVFLLTGPFTSKRSSSSLRESSLWGLALMLGYLGCDGFTSTFQVSLSELTCAWACPSLPKLVRCSVCHNLYSLCSFHCRNTQICSPKTGPAAASELAHTLLCIHWCTHDRSSEARSGVFSD